MVADPPRAARLFRAHAYLSEAPMLSIITRAATDADAPRIAQIYNQGINERIATFETRLRSADDMLASTRDPRFPYQVATVGGIVVGFASTSSYRERECYAGIAEFSVYIERDWRGQGIGRVLIASLCDAGQAAGFWKYLSRVFVENQASRSMLQHAGFREVGIYERHAQLDGRWYDVVIVEKHLELPQD